MGTKHRELRSLIFKHYDTEAQLARKLNWSRQKLNKITNGNKVPDIQELSELSRGLNISVGALAEFFLIEKSPNEKQNTAASVTG